MADRDQQKEQQDKRSRTDEPAVEDLAVLDEAAGDVKGGSISLNYTKVQQDYRNP